MAAYKLSLSFRSRASVEMLSGEGPLVRWEGIGFGLKGGELMVGEVGAKNPTDREVSTVFNRFEWAQVPVKYGRRRT